GGQQGGGAEAGQEMGQAAHSGAPHADVMSDRRPNTAARRPQSLLFSSRFTDLPSSSRPSSPESPAATRPRSGVSGPSGSRPAHGRSGWGYSAAAGPRRSQAPAPSGRGSPWSH